MKPVRITTTTMLSRYWFPIWGSQPTSVLWLMMPILPEPLGTSHTMR